MTVRRVRRPSRVHCRTRRNTSLRENDERGETREVETCRARRARTCRRPWRRTRRRSRSGRPPTRPRRAACTASHNRGKPAPGRCRQPGRRALTTGRCRSLRRGSARPVRLWPEGRRHKARGRSERQARIRPCARSRPARSGRSVPVSACRRRPSLPRSAYGFQTAAHVAWCTLGNRSCARSAQRRTDSHCWS